MVEARRSFTIRVGRDHLAWPVIDLTSSEPEVFYTRSSRGFEVTKYKVPSNL